MNIPFTSVLLRKSLADITQRKGRAVLVTLGILIGVLGLTAVNTANDVVGGAFIYSHDQSTSPDMVFSAPAVDPSVVATLLRIPNVARVQLRSEYYSSWHTATGRASIQIDGYTDLDHIQLGTFQLTSGRLPGAGEIVIDSRADAIQPVAIGDTVTVDTSGGTASLRVVGLARTPGWATVDNGVQAVGYMQASALQQAVGQRPPTAGATPSTAKARGGPTLNSVVMAKLRDTQQAMPTYQAVEQALTQAGVKVADGTLFDTTSGAIAINGMLVVIRVLALVALVSTCLLIVNTMNTLITEQMAIVGTMKALGGTRRTIMRGYLMSVGIYGVVGTILGLAAGVVVGNQIAAMLAGRMHIDIGSFQTSAWVVVVSVLVGLLLPPLAALGPLWQGTRLTVREAIAAYGVTSGQRSSKRTSALTTRFSFLALVPQTVWLGLRGIFRKRMRAVLTLVALTLSCAVFMSVQVATGSIGYTLDQQANAFTNDLTTQWGSIKYHPGIYEQITSHVQALPNVARVEPRMGGTVSTSQGELSLTGLEAQTQFFHYHLVDGRWLAPADANRVVLSDLAAGRLHLQVGDTLTLTQESRQVRWTVIGIVHDLQVGGGIGEAFTTIENMNVNLLGLPADTMMTLMVQAHDHSEDAVNQLAGPIETTLGSLGIQAQITTLQQMTAFAQSANLIIYVLFYSIAIIVALVGLLGLFNTISTSVLERRLEIGILRSLGAIGRRVASVFWVEGTTLALLAWVAGTLLGVPGAYGIIRLLSALIMPFDFYVPPAPVLTTLCFAIVVTLLASTGPALHASRMQLREVLRYE
jgi:putative ABC transport system permease protein